MSNNSLFILFIQLPISLNYFLKFGIIKIEFLLFSKNNGTIVYKIQYDSWNCVSNWNLLSLYTFLAINNKFLFFFIIITSKQYGYENIYHV